MDIENYFGSYTLAQETVDKLDDLRRVLDNDSTRADVAWAIVKPKEEKQNFKYVEHREAENDLRRDTEIDSIEESSTQFYFSQRSSDSSKTMALGRTSRWSDLAESLVESLEAAGDTPHLAHLKNLSDQESRSIVEYLSEKLSHKGTYALCRSLCSLELGLSMRYARIICSDLLLQKIIALNEPSRLISAAVQELVEKFPEDVREFVYVPLLNADIRDTSVFSVIVTGYPTDRKNELIMDFLNVVQDPKKWHIDALCQFSTWKISDYPARDKLLDLLLAKSATYSRDKNYAKFILSFIKVNPPFSENQKSKLSEIVAVNETIFKKVLENLLKNMYFRTNAWHVT